MFFEMNTRPVVVAAHAVDVSAVVRSTAETAHGIGGVGQARSPQKAAVSRFGPVSAQSPQTTEKSPNHVLQCCCASASVIVPSPWVFVR